MNNVWTDQELKAAEFARRAAMNYKKSAEYHESGDIEKALHHALLAATEIEYSTLHANKATDYYIKTIIDDMLEF